MQDSIEGTTVDWELLAAKIRLLHESDLDLTWWTKHLLPLCGQFIRASQGDVDKLHWNDLLKLAERYGTEDLNGWLLKFIPYVGHEADGVPSRRNPVLEFSEYKLSTDTWAAITGCTSDMLPTGLSFAPVTCVMPAGIKIPCQFVAGFTGVTQAPGDLSLRPHIGWAIAKAAPIVGVLERLRSEHEVHPPDPKGLESLVRSLDGGLPEDLWWFYTETNGAVLHLNDVDAEPVVCTIKGLGDLKPVKQFGPAEHQEYKRLSDRGLLSPGEYAEQRTFAWGCHHLRIFAELRRGHEHRLYVFGQDPCGDEFTPSRGFHIFEWTGELNREAFSPVAPTFSKWLEAMLAGSK